MQVQRRHTEGVIGPPPQATKSVSGEIGTVCIRANGPFAKEIDAHHIWPSELEAQANQQSGLECEHHPTLLVPT